VLVLGQEVLVLQEKEQKQPKDKRLNMQMMLQQLYHNTQTMRQQVLQEHSLQLVVLPI
jgi:hypothetical protein